MKFSFRLLALVSIIFLSSGCDAGLKKSLGISHHSPNEYSVMKNAPLSVPPNFELTPPNDDIVKEKKDIDKSISFSKDDNKKSEVKKEKTKGLSTADKTFMKKFDSHEKRKDIRDLIKEDAKPVIVPKEENKSGSVLSKIKNWF
jgi:hypothetical protein